MTLIVNPLAASWPTGTAVSAKREGSETGYVDGWVIGHTRANVIVQPDDPDIHEGATAIIIDPSLLKYIEGPVQVRWQGSWRFPTTPPAADRMEPMQQIGWFLQEVTRDYHDPAQRAYDLEQLAELILANRDALRKPYRA